MSDVFDEPHMRDQVFRPDPSELKPQKSSHQEEYAIRNSVWDEPGLSTNLVGKADSQGQSYKDWLQRGLAKTSEEKSWMVVCALVVLAGPWAILGTLISDARGGLMALVVFGPTIEEMLKIMAAVLVLEKAPYLFKNKLQVVVACLAGALGFAAIENLIYLNVYIENPSEQLVVWRWTVCLALHVCATAIAAMGLGRVWDQVFSESRPPRLELARPYLIGAIALHGLYNLMAFSLEGLFHPF